MENKLKGLLAIVLCPESVGTFGKIEHLTCRARYAVELLSSFLSKLKKNQAVVHVRILLNILLTGSERFHFVTIKLVFITGCQGDL